MAQQQQQQQHQQPPHHHHHDLNALGYNALHRLYHPALAEVEAAEGAVPRIEAAVVAARKVLAQKRAAFHPIQQAFLSNRERAMPTDCYQVIASYLDRLSRVRLAACDHHLHDYAVYGGNSGAAVWREGDELEKVYRRFGRRTTPLLHASYEGAVLPVRTLLVAKADAHTRDGVCMTPLHWASWDEHTAVALVTALLDAHADVNCTDAEGGTALLSAAHNDSAYVIPILISAGANINQRDHNGDTPLKYACYGDAHASVTALLAAGADVDVVDNNGWSALMGACQEGHGDIVTVLLEAGADVHLADENGRTALSLADDRGFDDIVDILLDAGADEHDDDDDDDGR